MDGFDLSPTPIAEPLDLTSTPPFVPPQNRPAPSFNAPQSKDDKRNWMKLLMLVPAAMKAGPGALQGLLAGWQQAEQAKVTQGRQDRADFRSMEQQRSLDDYRQAEIENQKTGQKRQFLDQFGKAVEGVDSPEALQKLIALYGGQAQGFGLEQPALEAYANAAAPPTKLQQRAAEKRIKDLKAQHGDKWMETGARFTHSLNGEQVPFQELLRRAGYTPDPNAPPPQAASSIAPDIPLDRQHAMALASGNTALAKTIEQSLSAQDAARRDPKAPPDPVLEEIRQLRLQQMQQGMASLPPAVARRVDSKSKGWDTLPVVKTTQKMAEAVSFASSLDINTKNPADDQALIYAFAKAMDPDSVVREGEYATVQHYAQSWAESFGFNAARIFSNTTFLTPQARANMKRTIQAKYAAGKQQYDNVRRSYAKQINGITGQQNGEDYLTDYGGGFPSEQPATAAPPSAPAKTQRIGRFEVTVEP